MNNLLTQKFYRKYRSALIGFLRRPLISLIAVVLVFFLAIMGFKFVPNLFFPPNDKPIFSAELKMPIGTPLAKTRSVVQQIENYMRDELTADSVQTEGIINWASFVGAGAPRYELGYSPEPESPHYAYMIINATSTRIITENLIPRMEKYCFDNFPDLTPNIKLLDLGPPVDAPVEVRISGRDTDKIFQIVDQVKAHMQTVAGTKNIVDDWGLQTKKLIVKIDQDRAHRAGLTNKDIAISLQTVLSGINTTDYKGR